MPGGVTTCARQARTDRVPEQEVALRLLDHVVAVFEDAAAGKLEKALHQACISVDATARKLYPSDPSVGSRFVRCVRDYYWLVEPMMAPGINLVDTRFANVVLKKGNPPDFAQVVYEVHRCSHAHGDEVPLEFELMPTSGPFGSQWLMGPGTLRIPDRVIWALCSVVVFSKVNHRLLGSGRGLSLTWGGTEKFLLSEWWGREDDVKPRAIAWNPTRLHIEDLGRLLTKNPSADRVAHIKIGPFRPGTEPPAEEQG